MRSTILVTLVMTLALIVGHGHLPLAGLSALAGNNGSDDEVFRDRFEEVTGVPDPEAEADLRLEKTASVGNVPVDGEFQYFISLDNLGPDSAVQVTVTDDLPAGVTVLDISADSPLSCASAKGVVTCEAGTLAPGSYGITLDVRAPDTPGVILNQVTVSASSDDPAPPSPASASVTVEDDNGTPPLPVIDAPELDPTVPTDPYSASKFLYTGDSPVQIGVAPGTIEPRRTNILAGQVLDRDGHGLSGVTVRVLNHPELGQTLSRADGQYNLVVNGGGVLTLDYQLEGRLPAQRKVEPGWEGWTVVDDVVLIELDDQVTAVSANANDFQVHQASTVSDDDGPRTNTLLFPPGTGVTATLADGSTVTLDTISVRATEYTVGPSGADAMPAPLPRTVAYTYAVELSADEAPGGRVHFDQTVYNYLDNYLGLAIGSLVPSGTYDRDRAAWIGEPSGRVIEILAIDNDLAVIDASGDGQAEDPGQLGALGFTDAERAQLAELYSPGEQLWRMPLRGFSPWDFNYLRTERGPVDKPPRRGPRDLRRPPQDPCEEEGSIIECPSQVLGKSLPVAGTNLRLNYRSDRVVGRQSALRIPLSGPEIGKAVSKIEVAVSIGGKTFTEDFPPSPNQVFEFAWDGLDVFGRRLLGDQEARVRVSHFQPVTYTTYGGDCPFAEWGMGNPDCEPAIVSRIVVSEPVSRFFDLTVSGLKDARGFGLAGWTLDGHHLLDRAGGVIYRGDGSRVVSSRTERVARVAGQLFNYSGSGDGGPATEAGLGLGWGIAAAPDGSFYVSDLDNHAVRRIDANGIIQTVAGGNNAGLSGDGGPATEAQLNRPHGLALGPDGSLYIADSRNHRIRRVRPDGVIETFAGSEARSIDWETRGDGGPAVEARLYHPSAVLVDEEGTVFIADGESSGGIGGGVFRIGTNGILRTMAGNGQQSGTITPPFEGPGHEVPMGFAPSLALGPQGDLYIAHYNVGRVQRIDLEGHVHVVAGIGNACFGNCPIQAEIDALEARISPHAVLVDRDGRILIGDASRHVIYSIGEDGNLWLEAGTGDVFQAMPDLAPARQMAMGPTAMAFGPNGLLVQSGFEPIVYRIPTIRMEPRELIEVAAPSGRELWHFDQQGRHLRTFNTLTGAQTWQFEYDDGRLVAMTDVDGNTISIERNGDGQPTRIIAPFGQETALEVDSDGYLVGLTRPGEEQWSLIYGDGGLLTGFTDPADRSYAFAYDSLGRLVGDTGPNGGHISLARVDHEDGYEVSFTSAEGLTTLYQIDALSDGITRVRVTDPAGAVTESLRFRDGEQQMSLADGTVIVVRQRPDPRFGLESALTETHITSPAGVDTSTISTREVNLADPFDPLILIDLVATTTSNGRTMTTTFDAATRTLTHISPTGQTVIQVLDEAGRIISEATGEDIDPLEREFNARGLPIVVSHGDHINHFEYDDQGRLVTTTDAIGRQTHYAYDEADRLVEIEHPSGRIVKTEREPDGRASAIITPSGAEHQLLWDSAGEMAGYQPPGNPAYTLSYDLDRHLSGSAMPSGRQLHWHRDAAGRASGASYPEAEIEIVYEDVTDRPARLTRSSVGNGQTQQINFDFGGSSLMSKRFEGVAEAQFDYGYDQEGFLVSLAGTVGTESFDWTLGRDADGRLAAQGEVVVSRDGPGRRPDQYQSSNFSLALTYDSRLRQTRRELRDSADELIAALDIAYNRVDWVVSNALTSGAQTVTWSYQFDEDGMLATVLRDQQPVESYAYDLNGNRISADREDGLVTASFDDQDRLLEQGGLAFEVDVDGFVTERAGQALVYSTRGELLSAVVDAGTVLYSNDGFGRRVARTDPQGNSTFYLYGDPAAPMRVTASIDPDGLATIYYYDHDGLLYAFRRNGSTYGVLSDRTGSPRIIANSAGQVVREITYDGFGRIVDDSNPGLQIAVGFGGGIPDPDTGLVRMGFRDYDPNTGRWNARDPIWFDSDQFNLYVYARNNPVSRRDPLGLLCIGASAYAGIGLGGSLCIGGRHGISLCWEAGFGAGGGLGLSSGDAKRTGTAVNAAMKASCAGLGIGIETSLDDCGDWKTKYGIESPFGDFKNERNHLTGETKAADGFKLPGPGKLASGEGAAAFAKQMAKKAVDSGRCKAEGKIAAEACVSTR